MIPQEIYEQLCREMEAGMERQFNSGGPRSRTRNQLIDTSLLGDNKHCINMPGVTQAALDFGELDPLTVVQTLLNDAGISDPELLRSRCELPAEPCICRESADIPPLDIATADPDAVLAQVAILSLATPFHFDPRRPVLLTRASLTRRLELFTGRGFYA